MKADDVVDTVPVTATDDNQTGRDALTRHWRSLAALLGGWLGLALAAALLWRPAPPGAWSERLALALFLAAVLVAVVLRLLLWARRDRAASAASAALVSLGALALGTAALAAGGDALLAALLGVLPGALLTLLALLECLPVAAVVALTMPALARLLASEPAPLVTEIETPSPPPDRARSLDPRALFASAAPPIAPDPSLDAAPAAPLALPRLSTREALAAIVAIALAARLVALGGFPASMTADEADNMQVILRIVHGYGPGLFGFDWKPMPAFSLHLMTPAVWLTNFSLSGLRLTSALLSTLALIPLYLVARRAMSTAAALATTALLSTTLWYLHFSRSGWENVQVCLYALALMWLLGLAIERERWELFAAAGGALALGMYGYFAGWSLPLAVIASLPLALLVHRAAWRRVLAGYGVVLAIALLLYTPQLISFSRNMHVLTGGRVGSVAITNQAQAGEGLPALLFDQAQRTARTFLLMDRTYVPTGLNDRYIASGWSFLDPVTGALYMLGLLVGLRRWRLTWLWWPMLLVPLAVTQLPALRAPDGARALIVAPVMLLFAGLALDWLVGERRWRHPVWASGVAAAVVAVMIFNVAGYIRWQSSPEAAASRQPAVEGDEITLWRERQVELIQKGQLGFNVGEWHRLRPARFTSVALSRAGALGGQAVTARRVTAVAGPGVPSGEILDDARDVVVSPDGVIWVVEAGRRQVTRYLPDGRMIGRLGGPGDGPGRFAEPVALVIAPDGAIHVLDAERGMAQVFGPDGLPRAQHGGDLGLFRPRDLALGEDGLLYIADTGRNRIVRLEANGQLHDTLPGASGDPVMEFNQPTAAAFIGGALYVTEPDAGQMKGIGGAAQSTALQWTMPKTDTLRGPRLAHGSNDEVVVTDVGGRQVVIFCPGGDRLAWSATTPEVGRLAAAALGRDGVLYVADREGRLLMVQLDRGCAG